MGVLTAKHCPQNLSVTSGDSLYSASIFTDRSEGDAQWHRAKISGNAQFQYDWGRFRSLSYTGCGLVMTEGTTGSSNVDSGGPCFYGTSAYGIHSGTNVRDGVARNWFTGSRSALSSMGLTEVTG